jgi:anti-sigma B factor antagonist
MTERTVDSAPQFTIRETDEPERVHVSVSGELDLATVPALEQRLDHLRAEKRVVRLDLSAVEYIDSTGVRLLVQVLTGQNPGDPAVEVEDSFTPHVRRVLELVGVDRLLAGT